MLLGGYKKETAEMILEVVRYLKDSGYVIQQPGRGQQMLMPPESPIFIRNDSDAVLPAFGCVQVTGTYEQGGQNYITVDKPVDNTGEAGRFLFNSRAPVAVGEFGVAHDGPLARMLTDGSAIVCGELWQPVVNSFLISPGGNQFSAIGGDDIATDVIRGLILGGGGGGGGTIQFTVDSIATAGSSSPYNGKQVATVTIEVAPCSRSSLIGEQVEVVDWSGCIWDMDEADLIGVWGWATEYVALSLKAGDPPGTLTPCHWAADDRCCVEADMA